MLKIITAGARWAGSALRPAVEPAIARLRELDDHLLRDIGLTRADIPQQVVITCAQCTFAS